MFAPEHKRKVDFSQKLFSVKASKRMYANDWRHREALTTHCSAA